MSIFSSWVMGGLIKANLKVYFDLVKDGVSHEDALAVVLKSRYPFEPGKKCKVMTILPGVIALNARGERATVTTNREELRDLICAMYIVEVKMDVDDEYSFQNEITKLINKYNDLYDSIKVKYV